MSSSHFLIRAWKQSKSLSKPDMVFPVVWIDDKEEVREYIKLLKSEVGRCTISNTSSCYDNGTYECSIRYVKGLTDWDPNYYEIKLFTTWKGSPTFGYNGIIQFIRPLLITPKPVDKSDDKSIFTKMYDYVADTASKWYTSYKYQTRPEFELAHYERMV